MAFHTHIVDHDLGWTWRHHRQCSIPILPFFLLPAFSQFIFHLGDSSVSPMCYWDWMDSSDGRFALLRVFAFSTRMQLWHGTDRLLERSIMELTIFLLCLFSPPPKHLPVYAHIAALQHAMPSFPRQLDGWREGSSICVVFLSPGRKKEDFLLDMPARELWGARTHAFLSFSIFKTFFTHFSPALPHCFCL